jgi:RNA polymerase sigma factor (sigma-70 family)
VTSYQEIHREIIELCKAGNPKAQKQLYLLYSHAMFNICFRMMNNREEAEDMLQESFTEAFFSLSSFRYESSFGSWLKRITVNKCINALKKRKALLVTEEKLPELIDGGDCENYEMQPLKVEDIIEAMKSLPEGYRVVFSLYLLEGYDHSEISQILGINEATSKSQYSRAKKRVQKIIKDKFNGRQI